MSKGYVIHPVPLLDRVKQRYILKLDFRKYFYDERSYRAFMDNRVAELNKENAKYYGYEAQSNQLVEECAELIQAVSKYRRAVVGLGQPVTEDKKTVALENYIEEIADVEIMLDQIKYLLQIPEDELEAVKLYKINRTRERIVQG
jgi:NTP pyrophosphatase (non-canonical NTP hydrolase)